MFDVEQHEAEWRKTHPEAFSSAPKMVQFVIRNSNGLVNTEKQANIVLIAFSLLMAAISMYLIFSK